MRPRRFDSPYECKANQRGRIKIPFDLFWFFDRINISKPAKPTGREVNRFRQFKNNKTL